MNMLSVSIQFNINEYRIVIYCPGPDKDFSINRFLAKHIHHLLGLPSSVLNTFSIKRFPVS